MSDEEELTFSDIMEESKSERPEANNVLSEISEKTATSTESSSTKKAESANVRTRSNEKLGEEIPNPNPNVTSTHVQFSIADTNSFLICHLCNGYFRDPYTVQNCLHTFCKSCLFFAFQTGFRQCPTCKKSLEPDPFRLVLSDRTLSTLIHKIFPHLDVQDKKDESEFYARRGIKRKPEFIDDIIPQQQNLENLKNAACTDNYNDFLEQGDEINFTLIPDTSSEQKLDKPQLRTSGRLKVIQLKKFLLKKLKIKMSPSIVVEILCNGDRLGDELSLTFINRTRWINSTENLKLSYRLSDEEGVSY